MGDSLIVKIGANAKEFDAELKKLQTKTKALESGLATAAKLSTAAFAALAGAVGVAVTKFSSFEKSFTNVTTLLDKSSFATKSLSKGITDLKNDVLKLGASSGESFESLNQGLFDLVSAGVPAEQATKALADAVNLATAGATDTATSVKALTAAYTAYGAEAGTSAEVAEKFFTAQKFGVTTVSDLASGFNKVAGTAKQLGIGFNEILAASTALTANGAKPTAQAFTEMKAVLNAVILAQGKLKNESAEVGAALSLQNIEQVGIVKALEQVKVATNGDVVAMQRLLGSSEALSAALSLTGQQAGVYAKIVGELSDEQARAAAFNDALITKQETLDKSLAKLSRSFEAIAVTIGEKFAPLVVSVAESLQVMAQNFSELDNETKETIVSFIKFGTVITAGIAGLTTFGLVAIKVKTGLTALGIVLPKLAIAARAFWTAITGPIGLAVAGITAFSLAINALYENIGNREAPKTLDEINTRLDQLIQKRKLLDQPVQLGGDPAEVGRIDKQIEKIEELRRAKIRASDDFGTGSLLVRPEADKGANLGASAFGIEEQTVPLRPEAAGGGEDPTIEKTREAEAQKTQIISEAEQKRLDDKVAQIEAERALEDEENIKKAEALALRLETEKQIEDDFRALTDEEKLLYNEKELEDLNNQILSKQELKDRDKKSEIDREVKTRNQYLKDEKKFGKTYAALNQALNSEEVQGASSAANELVGLQNSKNKTLKTIGQTAARTQIAIDTARGAMGAYSALSSIPLVGPALGIAAAGAVIAYGAERLTSVGAAQRGGVVPSAGGGARDRVPMMLEPNELVVPKGLAPDFIQSVGRPDAQNDSESETGGGSSVMITIEDDAADFIAAKQRENNNLSIGVT